jgi:DNA mismatch endonuclease (patch repair protein)
MDVFTKVKRSQVMAGIRSRGNRSTECAFAAMLRCSRISGWKLHCSAVAGKPDFYFKDRKLAVFVDGCFWHGCPKCFRAPRQHASFWSTKIAGNRNRDRKVTRALRHEGIEVIRLWEHDLQARTLKVRRTLELLSRDFR